MNFIIWIIVGALAGWIASKIMGTNKEQGFLMDVIVGVVGAFIGGFVLRFLGASLGTGILWNLIVAVVGAIILLWIVKAFRRRT